MFELQEVSLSTIYNFIDKNFDTPVDKTFYCKEPLCFNKRRFGVLQGIAIYCHNHRKEYMHDVLSKKCKYIGCITQPTFGVELHKAVYCKAHATANMINVKIRICNVEKCENRGVYKYYSTESIKHCPLFCKEHKTNGMHHIGKKNSYRN